MEEAGLNFGLAAQLRLLTSELHEQNEQILQLLGRLSKASLQPAKTFKPSNVALSKPSVGKKTKPPPRQLPSRRQSAHLSRSATPTKTSARCVSCSKMRMPPSKDSTKDCSKKPNSNHRPSHQTNISKLKKLSGKLLPKVPKEFLFKTRSKALNLWERKGWENPQ